MSLWNPYAFTILGEPVPQAAPPALRVYGGDATATQLAHAQNAFAAFSASTRVSFVPNPMEIGRLPDGSTYRITVVGNVATMELWVTAFGNAPDDTTALSGILFPDSQLVLANSGKPDRPTTQWRVVDVSKINYSRGTVVPMPGMDYNMSAALVVSRSAPGNALYTYSDTPVRSIYRYGSLLANLYSNDTLIGITDAGVILALNQAADGARQVVKSSTQNLNTLFRKYGAEAPPTVPTIAVDTPAGLLYAGAGDNESILQTAISKSGQKLAFYRQKYEGRYGPEDLIDGKVTAPYGDPYYCTVSNLGGSVNKIVTVRPDSSLLGIKWKGVETTLEESKFAGTAFPAPTVVSTLPEGFITPPNTFNGYYLPGEFLQFAYGGPALQISNLANPQMLRLSVSGVRFEPEDTWGYCITSYGRSGPVTRKASRAERSEGIHHLVYVGRDQLIAPRFSTSSSYVEYVNGSTSFSTGPVNEDFLVAGGPPQVGPALAKGENSVSNSSLNISIDNNSLTEIVLDDGQTLILNKAEYKETSSIVQSSVMSRESYITETSQEIHYTLDKQARQILVYDPSLDLLCYTEVESSVISSASLFRQHDHRKGADQALDYSAGPTLPTPPTPKLIIECQGRKMVRNLPFYPPEAGEVDKEAALLRLFANTGVAPGKPAFSHSGGGSMPDADVGTDKGFCYRESREERTHSDQYIGAEPETEGGFETIVDSAGGLRGMSPYIEFPIPTVKYMKTPLTGAAFMTISLGNNGSEYAERFVIDPAGVRPADTVVAGLPPNLENLTNWTIF